MLKILGNIIYYFSSVFIDKNNDTYYNITVFIECNSESFTNNTIIIKHYIFKNRITTYRQKCYNKYRFNTF